MPDRSARAAVELRDCVRVTACHDAPHASSDALSPTAIVSLERCAPRYDDADSRFDGAP